MTNCEKVKQICEILGVEPEEEFKINSSSSFYKLNIDLELFVTRDREHWYLSDFSIGNIISYGIIKIPQKPKLTNKDKISIKFLKNCGFHYVVYEKNKLFYIFHVFENEPKKNTIVTGDIVWTWRGADHFFPASIFDMVIDDQEPLCLDDFTEEDLKEN